MRVLHRFFRRDRRGYGLPFFEAAVRNSFAPLLVADWQVQSIEKNHNFGYKAVLECREGKISISTDYREGLSVWLDARDESGHYVGDWPGRRIELPTLVARRGVTTFDRRDATGWLHGDDLVAEVSRHAHALISACPDIVHGDFRSWPSGQHLPGGSK